MMQNRSRLAAGAALALLSAVEASAQERLEFGYKDRIFEQKYVLPEEMTADQAFGFSMVALGLNALGLVPGPSNPAVEKMLGGTCAGTFAATFVSAAPSTDIQRALEDQPDVPQQRPPAGTRVKVTCEQQVTLFYEAFSDQLSTDRQLRRLAKEISARFADDWLSTGDMKDPTLRKGAQRVADFGIRVDRIRRKGGDVAGDLKTVLTEKTVLGRMKDFADDATYAAVNEGLTRAETEVNTELTRIYAEAQRQRDEALQKQRAEQEAERRRVELEEKRVNLEKERAALDAGIAEARASLKGAEQQLAQIQGQPMPDYTRQTAMRQVDTQVRERRQRLSDLMGARKALDGAASADVQPQRTAGSPTQDGIGQSRTVSEKTIFCRSLDLMKAVLGRPIGAQRKAALANFNAQGLCTLLDVGAEVITSGPLRPVTPIGEAPVMVVAGSTRTGQQGFLLASALTAAP
ncbi:hypothetical protein [Aquabacter sediminis]|uniref:hypothetical protein n=1 Tax=Aquabacter sediminis TaxID=3029197 RepID=UPI00237D7650|nr:hypothetical protein [Aquabacter sp. P-9]MDE1571179.1 hypothetical protein [Aquabacter sp. P-9]